MLKDIYQLCPPIFALGLLRLDSPSSHIKDIYAQDRQFFALHKKRNLYIRASYCEEFDIEMSIQDLCDVPRLHVLVTQLARGIHQITPVYRGKSFFYGNDTSDFEIIQILIEMARRNGIDAKEFATYEQKNNRSLIDAKAIKCEVIN
jgi:hypothetical protein